MKRSAKVILCLLLLILLFALSSCGDSGTDNSDAILEKLLPVEQLDAHETRLYDVETPYTLCYENPDGTISMYIFASPIAYRNKKGDLELIDTSLVPVTASKYKKSGYAVETNRGKIKSYFPTSLSDAPIVVADGETRIAFHPEATYRGMAYQETEYTDLIGRTHDSVTYYTDDGISFEYVPTSAGVTVNITLHEKPEKGEIVFFVDKPRGMTFTETESKNVILSHGGEDVGIIRHSFVQDSAGQVAFGSTVKFEDAEDKVKYILTLEEAFLSGDSTAYPLSFSVSFEMLTNTLTCLTSYSEAPNDSLSAYSVIGDDAYFGTGALYLRYRVNYLIKTYPQNVWHASYRFVTLGGDLPEMYSRFMFVSGSWNTETFEPPSVRAGEGGILLGDVGMYSLDVKRYIGSCVYDDTYNRENNGLALFQDESFLKYDGMKLVANYNNSMYQPYVRIDFFDMPWTFENIDEINP